MTPDAISDGARLAALQDLGILDTEPEESFDRFTRLATDMLDVPVSLVSLVDRDRQFFKSSVGLPQLWADARQTPLSHSFCQHAVSTRRPLVIEDATHSRLVADNLAVRDLSVMAYAGFPLLLGGGEAVGAFCAIDTVPHYWNRHELRILEDLAAAVITLLDLRRALAHHGLHDRLTGLPDRALTVAYADRMSTAHPDGEMLAVTVGIDDLSAVNEAYGAQHGDRVLTLTARRIAHEMGPGDVVGRLDGDVFAVLRPKIDDQLEAIEFAHRIRDAVSAEPMTVRGEVLAIGATVGIATAARKVSGVTMITRAVEAMRHAKGRRVRVVLAETARAQQSATRLQLRGALRGAVARDEISVAFQPIVSLSTGETRGWEALARWQHPELGSVGPADFIPIAESSGEIVLVGEHVLRTACRQLARWRTQSSDDLSVTVNLSPVQLALANLPDVIQSILARSGLPGSALALELTEGVFTAAGALQRQNLERIRELGVQIALDDFGTGYSALSYLKRFPVDVIKVDRCFLDGLETDNRDTALMRSIVSIGSGMDIQVVAEGVETMAQRELLRLSGCPWAQGFLFARPLPAEEITLV